MRQIPRLSRLPFELRKAAVFTPTSIAGLQLWLDGSDITTLFTDSAKTTPVTSDGDVVGAWADKSGNGNDVLQTTTANKPLYKVNIKNNKSALLFDGISDYLVNAFTQLSQPYNVIIVAQMNASIVNNGVSAYLFDGNDVTNRNLIFKDASGTPDCWSIYAGTPIQDGDCNSNWNVYFTLFSGVSSDLRINGTSVVSGDAGSNNLDGITIACNYLTTSIFFKGYIAEILIYDPSISDANRSLLENYLNTKWAAY